MNRYTLENNRTGELKTINADGWELSQNALSFIMDETEEQEYLCVAIFHLESWSIIDSEVKSK